MRRLENPHKRRFIKLADFNKITKKMPFLAFLPILDDFQIFGKMP